MTALRVVPVTLGAARAFVERHHSHHHAPVGGLLACAVADGERLCCVAILSRPVARMLDARGDVAEVTRVATDRTRGAALLCLRALRRRCDALRSAHEYLAAAQRARRALAGETQ